MKDKLLNYGVEFQEKHIEHAPQSNLPMQIQESCKAINNTDEKVEIELYDESKQFDENFEDGSNVKYVLLPIYKEKNHENQNYTKLLNLGSKTLMNRKKVMDKFSEGLHYFVLDYDTIFGLRLLSFQKYNPIFFSCEERVLFETLLIKFHRFKFKEFYYSYKTIYIELGIKRDKAKTIVNKFIKLGFLNCRVKKSQINGRQSQITYFSVCANKIIDLVPLIYETEHQEQVKEELTMYLEPAIQKESNRTNHPLDITSIMQ